MLKAENKADRERCATQQASKGNIKKVFDTLLEEHEKLTEYNDSFIARIIERVMVDDFEWLTIRFIGEYEIRIHLCGEASAVL